ncbi:hypothetical protein GCM10011340_36100 [Roseivirga thermotolerans]|uniref:Uncharacterized protein n=1 Tax=Roseivirga thermotolerans TaxID=1758176 RepID=A0ABQ3I9V8_9BACT|nr:hypothetical protein GCM10011340_36100 [Roseivirga thermotolerans]|tara:strand:- start:1472 stop:1636 length:165 start_codon:yes stop_codon:yes gene_type:complete
MTDADLMKFANDHEESSNLYSLTTNTTLKAGTLPANSNLSVGSSGLFEGKFLLR